MLFTSTAPTHAEKSRWRRVLFPLKRANTAAFGLLPVACVIAQLAAGHLLSSLAPVYFLLPPPTARITEGPWAGWAWKYGIRVGKNIRSRWGLGLFLKFGKFTALLMGMTEPQEAALSPRSISRIQHGSRYIDADEFCAILWWRRLDPTASRLIA
jgi:hypothetical protein